MFSAEYHPQFSLFFSKKFQSFQDRHLRVNSEDKSAIKAGKESGNLHEVLLDRYDPIINLLSNTTALSRHRSSIRQVHHNSSLDKHNSQRIMVINHVRPFLLDTSWRGIQIP